MSQYAKLEGMEGVQHVFSILSAQVAIKVERGVIGPAAQLIVKAARGFAPVGTGPDRGLFRRSIGKRIRVYRANNVVVAIVGSRRLPQFKGRVNIAHLIESGFRVGTGGTLKRTSGKTAAESRVTGKRGEGTVVRMVLGKHVMRRAYQAIFTQSRNMIEQGINKAVNDIVRERRRA